jgi:hypothetical protein
MLWLDYSVDDVMNSTAEQFSCNIFYNSYFDTNSSALKKELVHSQYIPPFLHPIQCLPEGTIEFC